MGRRTSKRTLVIGVDEAGYGPNIGPLVIACSIWSIPDAMSPCELLTQLFPEFQPKSVCQATDWIPLGDSKIVYQGNQGLDGLLAGVRGLLAAGGNLFADVYEILAHSLERTEAERFHLIPWYMESGKQLARVFPAASDDSAPNTAVTVSISADAPSRKTAVQANDRNGTRKARASKEVVAGRRKLSSLDVEFIGFRTLVVAEEEFNQQLERLGNKSNVLSHNSLQLVRACLSQCLERYSIRPKLVEIYCDKHGGRNFYHGLLTHFFPECWFRVELESQADSRYQTTYNDLPMCWHFHAKGDRMAPSAAASMMAKLTRETFMGTLNQYWQTYIPGLRATAGYPGDATRFSADIAPVAEQLGFRRDQWWRSR